MTSLIPPVLQFLLAATFLLIPAVGARDGAKAQRAAENEMARQGADATLLARCGINFGATTASVVFAAAIGVVLAVLASLSLAGTGQVLTWIFQPVLFLLACVTMPGEVFLVRGIEAGFRKSGEPAPSGLDVGAIVDAAAGVFPSWFRSVILARFVLATLGSVVIVVLSATSP